MNMSPLAPPSISASKRRSLHRRWRIVRQPANVLVLVLVCGLLAAGRAAQPPQAAKAPRDDAQAASSTSADPTDKLRVAQAKKLLRGYFRTWSDRDMKGYEDCFLPAACIQYLDQQGKLSTYTRKQFVANQRKHHRTARHRMTEIPESMDVRLEGKLARAVVYWKLTAGPRTDFGYDHFTLIEHRGEWRIVNLIFYSEE